MGWGILLVLVILDASLWRMSWSRVLSWKVDVSIYPRLRLKGFVKNGLLSSSRAGLWTIVKPGEIEFTFRK